MRGIAMAVIGATWLWLWNTPGPMNHADSDVLETAKIMGRIWFFITVIVVAKGW